MSTTIERTVASWVRVADETPDNTDDVLLYIPDAPTPLQIGYYNPLVQDWWVEGRGYLRAAYEPVPTHWAPLPEGPR